MTNAARTTDLLTTWVGISHRLSPLHDERLMLAVQAVGKFDKELRMLEASAPQWSEVSFEIDKLLYKSGFWLLGAYELVRTVHEKMRNDSVYSQLLSFQRLTAYKRRIERIRMPLAKLERPERYQSDSGWAQPIISRQGLLGWSVVQDATETRTGLADDLVDVLWDIAGQVV